MWGADKHKKMDIGKFGGKTTIVAQEAEINGDISFSGILQVDGRIIGNINAEQGLVRVSEHGRVQGVITAPNVLINGEVIGDVHAHEHLELDAKARINGNLYYRFIEMVMGAQISGTLNHLNETASVTPIAQIADRTRQDE
ncbi:bactofilin family protein [Halopseudomonas salina]|uniref:Protein CcmA, bactofilin family n=1 Tax=Halopseudomonas salina TaxID=1323744 RepID=A0ABQ1Q4K5_9GAMM|nr:polymer-forming cytoskeletal protein [Halopseudomonas salina]GGD12545.1 hypothetical protein GCM10007418_34310 [Halopseudomonas salina]